MKNFGKNKGISILGIILVSFLILLALSFFKVSIKDIIESPTGQENFNYIRGEIEFFWSSYLAEPVNYLWNDIIVNIFWKGFISNNFEKAAESIKLR